MKKKSLLYVVFVLVLLVSLAGCAKDATLVADNWKWTPGADEVTSKSSAADDWSPTYTVFVKIVGGDNTVMFDGKVVLTSPQMMASEFLSAAITDKGYAQVGLDVGFISKVGDYENDSTTGTYWMFYVNGDAPSWGANEFRMRDGDYLLLTYEKYEM